MLLNFCIWMCVVNLKLLQGNSLDLGSWVIAFWSVKYTWVTWTVWRNDLLSFLLRELLLVEVSTSYHSWNLIPRKENKYNYIYIYIYYVYIYIYIMYIYLYIYIYISISIYIYIYIYTHTQSAQISQKQDGHNTYM